MCGIGTLTISDGQSVTGNCHSLDTKVAYGPVTVTFGSFSATLPTGTASSISPDPIVPGKYVVYNDPASAAAIVADGNTVVPGASITLQSAFVHGLRRLRPRRRVPDGLWRRLPGRRRAVEEHRRRAVERIRPSDFSSVPVPALLAAPGPTTTFRANTLSANGAAGDLRLLQSRREGRHYGVRARPEQQRRQGRLGVRPEDRNASPPGPTLGPDGVIGAQEAQKAFSEYKAGLKCTSGTGYRQNGP